VNTSSHPISRTIKTLLFSAGTLTLIAFAGCGMGAPVTSTARDINASPAVGGHLRGGEQAITGATVTIYSTKNTGVATNGVYVGAANVVDTTTTDSNGNFKFTDGPTCTSPNQVYFVASGGNSGSNTGNSGILLMAAIGDCSLLNSTLIVDIDEVTTVAAAYALRPFLSLSGTTVNVTSSSTNYAGVSGTGTTTSAAGLAHAFLNANNLANYVTGTANSTVTGAPGSVVPNAVINGLADALQSCVNSTGGSATGGSTPIPISTPTTPTASAGATFTITYANAAHTAVGYLTIGIGSATAVRTAIPQGTTPSGLVTLINSDYGSSNISAVLTSPAVITVTGPTGTANTLTTVLDGNVAGSAISDENNDGTNCGRLFGAATPPSGAVPTNTLQSVLNIATYPAYNAVDIFTLIAGASAAFQPAVTALQLDWMIGISYPLNTTGIGQTTSLYNYMLTLDANDNVYSGVLYPSITSATASCLGALSSSGTLLSGTGWDCLTTDSKPNQIAADANGYLWVANNAAAPNNILEQVSATSGVRKASYGPSDSPTTHVVQAVAVDKNSNIYYNSAGSGATLSFLAYTSGAYPVTGSSGVSKSSSSLWDNALGIAIDASGNVWGSAAAARSVVVYNPTNNNTANYSPSTAYTLAYGVSFDSSGNAWVPHEYNTVTPFTYTASSTSPSVAVATSGVTSVTDNTFLRKGFFSAMDGNGVLWVSEPSETSPAPSTTSGISAYKTSSDSSSLASSMPGATQPYAGCQLTTSGDCKTSGAQLFQLPENVAVDAAGSIWVSGGHNTTANLGDNVVQVIGLAAPAWPLLSIGKPGVMP
jgi:hypothetical protein